MAINYTPGCLQLDPSILQLNGTDDCLDLDVYTPTLPSDGNFSKPLPVMVWFYGGAFIYGSSWTYQGQFFMDEDIVLVVPNYRLGPYGFLNLGIEEARGNQGVKDQVLALKWVRDNIDKFGGDPAKVTIVGESAGATSVSLHVLSKMSNGLFSQAIIQSGGAPCRNVFIGNPVVYAKELGAELGCDTRDANTLVECLKAADPVQLLTIMTFSAGPQISDDEGMVFGPTYETFFNGESDPNVLISQDAFTLLQNGDFAQVPMIIGQTSHEGFAATSGIFQNLNNIDELNKKFGRVLPKLLMYEDSADDPCVITGAIREYFFNGRNVSYDDFDTMQSLMTDRIKSHCVRKMTSEISKFAAAYVYNFTQKHSLYPDMPPTHGQDIAYMFPYPNFPIEADGGSDYVCSSQMIRLWANFARDGKPGMLWGGSEGIEWTPLEQDGSQQWLQLNSDPQLLPADSTFENNNQFWDSLPLNEFGKVN